MTNLKQAALASVTEPPSRLIGIQLSTISTELKPHLPQSPSMRRLVIKNRAESDVNVQVASPSNLSALMDIPDQFKKLKNGKIFLNIFLNTMECNVFSILRNFV